MRQASKALSGLLVLFAVTLTACQDKSLGEVLWPKLQDPYFQLTEQWSRKGVIRMGLESEVSVVALLKSAPWREAYVARYSRLQGLDPQETEKMLKDQMRAHDEAVDVVLAVSATYPEHARLTHRLSRWQVFLETSYGRKIDPLEVRPKQWPPLDLEAYFPAYSPWQRYYTARFPSGLTPPATLVITGPPGRIVLVWDEFF